MNLIFYYFYTLNLDRYHIYFIEYFYLEKNLLNKFRNYQTNFPNFYVNCFNEYFIRIMKFKHFGFYLFQHENHFVFL